MRYILVAVNMQMWAPVVRIWPAICFTNGRTSQILPTLWKATILIDRRHLVLASSPMHDPHQLFIVVAVRPHGVHLAINGVNSWVAVKFIAAIVSIAFQDCFKAWIVKC